MTLTKTSVAVVTGAASGIGRALAVRLAEEGAAGLAIADVNEAGLDETAGMIPGGVKVSKHVVDVSSRDEMRRCAEDAAREHDDRVTHLINNAGVGLLGSFEQISLDDMEWLMNINFWGTVYGVKFFLPVLKRQDAAAHIVNLSSVFGFIAPPEQTAYCASKFAVRGFTESLRHELAGTNVRVSLVHPGGIKTNIARNSRLGAGAPEEYKKQGAEFFDKVAMTAPEAAAEKIVRGIRDENPRILIGSDARLISYIQRLFPKNYLRALQKLSGHRMSLRE
jgi:NAD(P)-dependent dehydrogenase (short-subunit alcohol dehydrogenase family)